MNIAEWLAQSQRALSRADIDTARLDTLVMLEDVLRADRAQLLAHPECEITPKQLEQLRRKVRRRTKHEPLAYIRRKTEFYGREFYIDHRVLEPRPESETMIEVLKALPLPPQPKIIDVGTGSGALAITAKLAVPQSTVIATDIDQGCITVASRNAKKHGTAVAFFRGDLLEAVTCEQLSNTILLCNLPYVPDSFKINSAAMREPRLAIFGGPDGLELYRKLFGQIATQACTPLYVLTESLPPQHDQLANIALAHGFVLDQKEDFIQMFRTATGSSAS